MLARSDFLPDTYFQQSFSRPGNPQYPPQPSPMHQNPANPYQNYPVQGQDQANQNDYLVDEHIDNNYPQYNQYQDFGNGNQQVTFRNHFRNSRQSTGVKISFRFLETGNIISSLRMYMLVILKWQLHQTRRLHQMARKVPLDLLVG